MDLRTGAAFWPIKNGLIGVYPGLEHDETCDVAIVGAGITGALVAHHLSQAGCDVVVLDRHDAAAGSTAATTGLLQYETDTSLTQLAASVGIERAVQSWRLGRQAISQLESLSDSCPCGFTRRPALYLASSRWDVRSLEAECRLREAHGFGVEWLNRQALSDRYGLERPAAIVSSGAAELDAYRLAHSLLATASRRGARVYDRTNVDKIEMPAGCVKLLTNRGTTVRAQRLVVASGYEVPPQFGLDPGNLNSTWVFISEPLADLSWWPERALIWETSRPYTYLRTTADGRVLIGGEDEGWSARHENVRLLGRKTLRLNKRFSALFPGVRLEPAYAWAGVFAATKDGLPYIGALDEWPRAWFALGYGGNGITFSMVAADLAVDWWRGVHNSNAGLFAFNR
jgi:glycine/D-amino acid oxidase-like deaminating enzyme